MLANFSCGFNADINNFSTKLSLELRAENFVGNVPAKIIARKFLEKCLKFNFSIKILLRIFNFSPDSKSSANNYPHRFYKGLKPASYSFPSDF